MSVRWILLVAALGAPQAALAQERSLDERFDPRTRAAILAVVDSARADGLPVDPLINKALEGASRGAEPERIIWAVRGLARRLKVARDALGTQSTEAELVAGAAALYSGIAPEKLEQLRAADPGASVALPLVVLADIVERGVPQDTAVSVILTLAGARVADDDYTALRVSVAEDIQAGAPPGVAAQTRARGILLGVRQDEPRPDPR